MEADARVHDDNTLLPNEYHTEEVEEDMGVIRLNMLQYRECVIIPKTPTTTVMLMGDSSSYHMNSFNLRATLNDAESFVFVG